MRPALLLLTLGLLAAAPAPAVQRLYGIELAYDPAAWTLSKVGLEHWRAEPADREGQTVEIRTDYGGPCSQEAMAALAETTSTHERARGTTTLPSGLVAHWAAGTTGCRNATAAPIAACVVRTQTVHLFTAASSCRHSYYAKPSPLDLLQGLRPR